MLPSCLEISMHYQLSSYAMMVTMLHEWSVEVTTTPTINYHRF